MRTNKYAGVCQCGAKVEAGAGFWQGITYCQMPNELNNCPIHQDRADAMLAQRAREDHERYLRGMASRPEVADGVCWKCEGNGKYVFANGTIGICYGCNGSGKESK